MRSMMKRRSLGLTVVFWLLCLSGCAPLSVPRPVPRLLQPDSSGLAISLKIRAPVALFSRAPDVVFFAKTDGGGGIRQIQLLRSNYAKEGRVYFLNLPPGSYAAVAAFNSVEGRGYITYFPKELVEQTQVTVRRGEVAFMGHYVVDQSVGLSEADPIQLHYSEVIAPGTAKSGFGLLFSGLFQYRGSINEARWDSETRNELLVKAKEDLAEGGWMALMAPASGPPRPAAASPARVYTNRVHSWSVSYPDGWILNDTDPGSVKLQPPPGSGFGLVGVHSITYISAQSLEDFTEKALAGWERNLRPGLKAVTLSRRTIRLANDVPAIEVIHELGTGETGKSRKIHTFVKGKGFILDAETYSQSWDLMQPDFDRILGSFTIQ